MVTRTGPASLHAFAADPSRSKSCLICGRRADTHIDLEQLRRQLVDQEAAATYRRADVFVIPTCPDCGGPFGMAVASTRDGFGLSRCGPCSRSRKARRRADRRRGEGEKQ